MAFSKSYRLERVYFERLKSMIDILKPYLNEETDEKLKAILENSIDDNGAILLLYRNLGEAWAELSDLIKKADEKIDQTKEEAEKYHDELNERIDEVNNYIMGLIRFLEEHISAIENDLSTMPRVKFLDLVQTESENYLLDGAERITFEELGEMIEFPHYVIVRGTVGNVKTYFIPVDSNVTQTGSIEFYATTIDNSVTHETVITALPDDTVVITEKDDFNIWAKKSTGDHANVFNAIDGNSQNSATGAFSNAFGSGTTSSGPASHAEGGGSLASGSASHAEGGGTRATGEASHSEGQGTQANGTASHAEGAGNVAEGIMTHVGGSGNTARAQFSFIHGVGCETLNYDSRSVVFGLGNESAGNDCLTFGRYCNTINHENHEVDTWLEVVGNGSGPQARSDARSLDKYGNEYLAGAISPSGGIRLRAPNNQLYSITIDNNGNLVIAAV